MVFFAEPRTSTNEVDDLLKTSLSGVNLDDLQLSEPPPQPRPQPAPKPQPESASSPQTFTKETTYLKKGPSTLQPPSPVVSSLPTLTSITVDNYIEEPFQAWQVRLIYEDKDPTIHFLSVDRGERASKGVPDYNYMMKVLRENMIKVEHRGNILPRKGRDVGDLKQCLQDMFDKILREAPQHKIKTVMKEIFDVDIQ